METLVEILVVCALTSLCMIPTLILIMVLSDYKWYKKFYKLFERIHGTGMDDLL